MRMTEVSAQWTLTSFPSLYSDKKIEIGTATHVPDAWINTYSGNCIPSIPEDPPIMVPALTNHIRMSQIGNLLNGDDIIVGSNPSYNCTLQTDYYFRTDIEESKLILDASNSNSSYYKYMTFYNTRILMHQNTSIDGTLSATGDLNCGGNIATQSLTASSVSTQSLTSSNITTSELNSSNLNASNADIYSLSTGSINNTGTLVSETVSCNNLIVNNAPTFNNGLNIKNSALKILDNNNNVVWNFRADGKLGIGVADAQMTGPYWLWVKNGIMTERVKVAVKGTADWSDKVFDPSYRLAPLHNVEAYIAKHKHLPEIPSAEEVVKNGIDLQQMDAKLLQKIEELTLYVINLKKELTSLKKNKK